MRRFAAFAVLAVVAALVVLALGHRSLAPLDLGDPAGVATGAKLAALADDFPRCRALLDRAGVRYMALPPRHDGPSCGYADAVRFAPGGSRRIAFAPANLGIACPVAAALAMWEWDVVQPAALRRFGVAVVAIDHFGSYNCRRISHRDVGAWSEHATADAVDVAGFRFADGRRVTVARDWQPRGPAAEFLHDVRDGACPLFATVLSPDYNAAHHDHLHLDQARRGGWGWRACR
ncbi:extensin family protein [uncultured Sphingomonas sp.]|uniref:extensin-like domain-containing protein n=1 Tax=uncultured Sphingomonas sp. TaxID=158754 RepID=UPI0035CC3AC2